MKLNIYLARESIQEPLSVLQRDYTPGGDKDYVQLEPSGELPFPCTALLQPNRPSTPSWISFVNNHFDVGPLSNVSNSLILIVNTSGRYFAVCFGSAWRALDMAKVQPAFGLRVCANAMDSERIRSVDTRDVDVVSKQQRIQLSKGSALADFGIEPQESWVRLLSGKPNSRDIAASMAGADGLSITAPVTLEALGQKCDELYALHESAAYKDHFEFIDYFRPVPSHDPVVAELEEELLQRIIDRSSQKVSIAPPTIIDDLQLDHFTIQYYTSRDVEVLSLSAVYDFLDSRDDLAEPLEKVRIEGVDGDGVTIVPRRTLKDYLVCEVDRDLYTYVLSVGDWYQISKEHSTQVREYVRSVPDVTDDLQLPEWDRSIHAKEGDYNKSIAADNRWCVLDADDVRLAQWGPAQKVEVCDLVTSDLDFIAVKHMESSATLSHLFAQASVSAELLRSEPDYVTAVLEKVDGSDVVLGRSDIENGKIRFIYAIATDKGQALPDALFFFSALNMRTHVKKIRSHQFDVAIARVSYKPKPKGES